LTTFRPTEEFEAGPSRYTPDPDPDPDSASASWEDEQDVYFRENNAESNGSAEAMPQSTPERPPSGDTEQASTAANIPDAGNDTEEEDEDEIEDVPIWDDDEEVDLENLEGFGWDPEAGVANVRAPVAPAVVEQPQQDAVEPAPPEANEEQEGNVEDDMEGAMEGVSLGPYVCHLSHPFDASTP
jgi:E3 ubiquitin-protein ligase MARCH6